jgi:hypothetical protein
MDFWRDRGGSLVSELRREIAVTLEWKDEEGN